MPIRGDGDTSAIVYTASNQSWMVLSDGVVFSDTSNAVHAIGWDNVTLHNKGTIFSDGSFGVQFECTNSTITNEGVISGDRGIFAGGSLTISNSGTISGGRFESVYFQADSSVTLFNDGLIFCGGGGDGIYAAAGGVTINSGMIQGRYGYAYSTDPGETTLIRNSGSINGADTGIHGVVGILDLRNSGLVAGDRYSIDVAQSSSARVSNFGRLEGDIALTEAADTLRNGGIIVGDVELFSGDDLYQGRGGEVEGLINGMDGDDSIFGGARGEAIEGWYGDDVLSGLAGDDTLSGGTENDLLLGGTGEDMASYRLAIYAGVTVNLSLRHAQDTGGGGTDTLRGIEHLEGSVAADKLTGDAVANLIRGFVGLDTLVGGGGDDTLRGGGGRDDLNGGAGGDILIGGDGADLFRYKSATESFAAADVITDFLAGDIIHLKAIDANTTVAGDQHFSFVGSAAFSSTAGELRFTLGGGARIVEADVNGDGKADFRLIVDGFSALSASDFVL